MMTERRRRARGRNPAYERVDQKLQPSSSTDGQDYGEPPCRCHLAEANSRQFRTSRALGVDKTDGRFGDANILQCVECGSLWLRYMVEYEAFSRSGRWARGQVTAEEAERLTPEAAADAFAAMSGYLYGGSYFNDQRGYRRGRMIWSP